MYNQKETMTPAQEDHEARRRKLLRFGVATPMVLTLHPGSSFGASTTCAARIDGADQARGEAADKLATSPDADEWVRAQVDIVELSLRGANPEEAHIEGQYVLGTDGTYWRVDSGSGMGPLIASAKSTPRVSAGAGGGIVGKDSLVSVTYTTDEVDATPVATRWALVKVDPNTGEPLGYSWEPQAMPGVYVSVGCLASMAGLARYNGTFGGIGEFIRRALGLA